MVRSHGSRPSSRVTGLSTSDDGRFGYLASQGQGRYISVTDTKTHSVIRNVGPFSNATRPCTINGRQTLIFVNVNDLLGFEVGDLTTGEVLHRVEVEGFPAGRSLRTRFWPIQRLLLAPTGPLSDVDPGLIPE